MIFYDFEFYGFDDFRSDFIHLSESSYSEAYLAVQNVSDYSTAVIIVICCILGLWSVKNFLLCLQIKR